MKVRLLIIHEWWYESGSPDIRDRLKPVLFEEFYMRLNEMGMGYEKAYKKSARVVGEVLG